MTVPRQAIIPHRLAFECAPCELLVVEVSLTPAQLPISVKQERQGRYGSSMPFVQAPSARIHYEVSGSGPRLMLLNGSGTTIENSRLLIDFVAAHFEVAVHDQRGLGATELAASTATMADYGNDVLVLLDHLGWDTCRVVGLSFGGMVAQEFAVTHPERIDRLALLCTSPGGAGGSSYPLHELSALEPEERARVNQRIMDLRFTDDWLIEHESDRGLVDMMRQRWSMPTTDAVQRGEELQLSARRHHDAFDRLRNIACPTLVAAGQFDGTAPLANSEALAREIPLVELRVYEGGHMFFLQDRQAFPDIIEFLSV